MTEMKLFFKDGLKARVFMNSGDIPLNTLGDLVSSSFLAGEIDMRVNDSVISRSVNELTQITLERGEESFTVKFSEMPKGLVPA